MARNQINLTQLQPSKAEYASVGLPSLEEQEDIPPPFMGAEEPKPTPKAMGDNDVESIIYINLEKKIPAELQTRLKQLEESLKISNQWLSLKAGILTEQKIRDKKLPVGDGIDDQLKRAAYRAKVVEFYMNQHTPWVLPYAQDIRKRSISVHKSQLHLKLLEIIIEGIVMPTKVHDKIETILKSISDGINIASKSNNQQQFYWILLTVYKYDERQNAVIPTIRSIYFSVTQEIKEYTANKAKYEEVNFVFGFAQRDFHFTESVWKGVESETIKYLTEQGVKIIRETPDVPVD